MAEQPYVYKALNRAVGKAVCRHRMIADGDRILVGLSGGKDSTGLMWMLEERRRRAPVRYELVAVHVDPGFGSAAARLVEELARRHGWQLHVETTDYGPVAHSDVNRENPCFLCARLRRKRLFELARHMGCNKVALGHNQDDFIETLMMNILYAGEISTMCPVQPFFGGRFVVIRPLVYAAADLMQRFCRTVLDYEPPANPCPSSGRSKRSQVRAMLAQLYRSNRKIRGNIFHALSNVRTDYLLN